MATASCTSVQRRPGPGELDDLGSCGWLDAPRTRGPFGYAMRRVEAGSYKVGCPPSDSWRGYPPTSEDSVTPTLGQRHAMRGGSRMGYFVHSLDEVDPDEGLEPEQLG